MATLKHYPDKPYEAGLDDLSRCDDGNHICQQKTDGWRMEVCKTIKGQTAFISRHNKPMDSDVESHIQEQMSRIMALLPNGSQLDGEWLSRREATNKRTKPKLVLFDVIRYNRRWLLNVPYVKRWQQLQDIWNQAITEHGKDAFPDISLALTAPNGGFVEFYESQKTLAHSEGVVIKHKASTLIADRNTSKKNPRWLKIKYRGASDGNCTMKHLRGDKW